jgi:tetratricopeptide (TPR) repeat protein
MAKAAVAAWEKTVELEPDHVEAMYGVVEFYFVAPGFAGGDDDLAKLRLQELESISAPWANLSKASRAQEAESFEESERLFNLAINGIPNRAFPQMMLANLYMKLDKHEKALSALETYKRRTHTWNDPGPAPTELMAAKIYQSLERKQDAISSLEIVMRENPQPNILDQAQNLLKELK